MPQVVLPIGEYNAIVDVQAPGVARLLWQGKNGKMLSRAPVRISKNHPEPYRQIREKFKTIKKTLAVQTRRIESFYLEGSAMSFVNWQQNFAQHTLVKTIANSLIWRFNSEEGDYSVILHDGKLVFADGSPIPGPIESTIVSLWHPLDSDPGTRDAWRNFIWRHSIVQPFRQAYRETYQTTDLTDINEVVAGLYVNQHQFRALLVDRGWRYQFRGNFESESTPVLYFADDLSCEIGIGAESQSLSCSAISLSVELVDIRFLKKGSEVSANKIPPILFSEVLRNIDLFTSVSGIGYKSDWEYMESVFDEVVELQIQEALVNIKGTPMILTDLIDENPLLTALTDLLLKLDAAVDAKPVTGVLKLRRELLTFLLGESSLAGCTRVEGRYVFIDGCSGQYRINLASGLIYNCADSSLQGTVGTESSSRLNGEASGDILLAKIYNSIERLAKTK